MIGRHRGWSQGESGVGSTRSEECAGLALYLHAAEKGNCTVIGGGGVYGWGLKVVVEEFENAYKREKKGPKPVAEAPQSVGRRAK
jgi:hypothetical protein